MPAIISNMMQRYKIYLKNSMFLQDFFKIYNGLNPDKEKKKRRIKKESYNPLNTSRKRQFCKKIEFYLVSSVIISTFAPPKAVGKAYRWLPFIIYF